MTKLEPTCYFPVERLRINQKTLDKSLKLIEDNIKDRVNASTIEFFEVFLTYLGKYIESGEKFDLKRIEPLQYTVYGEGGKYDWHIDPHGYSEMFKGVRKLSMTMYLNDGYEGGNFQIETGGPNNPQRYLTFFPEKGAILFFPSITWHRVTPVIRGIRKSLVAWFLSDHG